MTYTGGCLCGALRYTAEAEPVFVGKCYCTHCHKETGTGHITVAGFPEESVTLDGTASIFKWPEGSPWKTERYFCSSCGTTVFTRHAVPGLTNVRVGTIDQSENLRAGTAIFAASASPWDLPPPGLQIFPGMRPRE